MPQPTGLFCHTVFFVEFNICTSLEMLREHMAPHDFQVEQGHSVSYKVWRDLLLKAFYGKWGAIYLRGRGSTWWINDQIMPPRVGEFHKYIFQ